MEWKQSLVMDGALQYSFGCSKLERTLVGLTIRMRMVVVV